MCNAEPESGDKAIPMQKLKYFTHQLKFRERRLERLSWERIPKVFKELRNRLLRFYFERGIFQYLHSIEKFVKALRSLKDKTKKNVAGYLYIPTELLQDLKRGLKKNIKKCYPPDSDQFKLGKKHYPMDEMLEENYVKEIPKYTTLGLSNMVIDRWIGLFTESAPDSRNLGLLLGGCFLSTHTMIFGDIRGL